MLPMPNRLPQIFDKHKICIICEGNEEYEYLNRLKSLGVWNEKYEIALVNAGGNDIRIDTRMRQMNWYLCFVTPKRNHMNNMVTLREKSMSFMMFRMLRTK